MVLPSSGVVYTKFLMVLTVYANFRVEQSFVDWSDERA